MYEPEKGDLVLSGSDDHTAKLWEDCECVATCKYSGEHFKTFSHEEGRGRREATEYCSWLDKFWLID